MNLLQFIKVGIYQNEIMRRKFFKAYFLFRRKISSRVFFFIEKIFAHFYSRKINKANYKLINYYFAPVEVQLNQNILVRQEECQFLIEAYNTHKLSNLVRSIKKMERNKVYRWNAFYPLYSLLSENTKKNIFSGVNVKEIVLAYIEIWIDEHMYKCRANPFVWYDMADAFRIIFFHKIMSLYDTKMTHKLKSKIEYTTHIHEYFLLKDELLQEGNHRIFQHIARMYINILRNDSVLLDKEKKRLVDLFYSQFSDEGFHAEHSPEYHLWANYIFSQLIKQYNLKSIEKQISKITQNSNLFFSPDGNLPLIGDSGLDNIKSYKTELFNPREPLANVISKDYIISTNREIGWYFICLISNNSIIHKHKDSSTFELFILGRKIITDCGKFSYAKSALSKQFRAEESHNISYLKEDLSIFSTQTYNLVKHEKFTNIEIISIQAKSKKKTHTRRFIHNAADHLIIIDIIDNHTNCFYGNFNLVNANSYSLKQKEGNSLVFYSNEMNTEISFFNVQSSLKKNIKISKIYDEFYKDNSIEVCSTGNVIITSIIVGKESSYYYKNDLVIKCGIENIKVFANGDYEIMKQN